MSLIDTYRRSIVRKREDIARLQDNKAKEQGTIAKLMANMNRASEAASRTKNANTVRSRQNEIQRYQKSIATSEKKIAEIDKKIAHKHKELINEQKKLAGEEKRELKKRNAELAKQAREQSMRMRRFDIAISRHDAMHKNTQLTLERLQTLPERIIVLFLATNPLDQERLRLDEEARLITEMIRKAEHRNSVQFETRWAVQPLDILQAINELNPTVIHFSGHGTDKDEIVFQSSDGTTKLVSMEAIVQTMMASSDSIRLVFFNMCYSDKQAEAVTQYVEAAIGMTTDIGDHAARIFASQFYSSLSFGHSLRKAFEQAKASLMLKGIEEENTPELFFQNGLSDNDIVIVRPVPEEQQ